MFCGGAVTASQGELFTNSYSASLSVCCIALCGALCVKDCGEGVESVRADGRLPGTSL